MPINERAIDGYSRFAYGKLHAVHVKAPQQPANGSGPVIECAVVTQMAQLSGWTDITFSATSRLCFCCYRPTSTLFVWICISGLFVSKVRCRVIFVIISKNCALRNRRSDAIDRRSLSLLASLRFTLPVSRSKMPYNLSIFSVLTVVTGCPHYSLIHLTAAVRQRYVPFVGRENDSFRRCST